MLKESWNLPKKSAVDLKLLKHGMNNMIEIWWESKED